jgi:hypothetical protein
VAPTIAPAVIPIVFITIKDSNNNSKDNKPKLKKTLKAEQPAKFNRDTAKLYTFLNNLYTYFKYYFP